MDTLFKGVTAVTMSEQDGGVIKDAFVGVSGGKISYVGREIPREPAASVIEGAGKVLIPGLINAHTHLPMAFLRGYADDSPLREWLYDHVFPAEAKLTDRAVEICSRAGIAEAVSFGTTSVSDMYSHLDSIFKAADEAGSSTAAATARSISVRNPISGLRPAPIRSICGMHLKWHGVDGGRLRFDASIHAEYTSSYPLGGGGGIRNKQ